MPQTTQKLNEIMWRREVAEEYREREGTKAEAIRFIAIEIPQTTENLISSKLSPS